MPILQSASERGDSAEKAPTATVSRQFWTFAKNRIVCRARSVRRAFTQGHIHESSQFFGGAGGSSGIAVPALEHRPGRWHRLLAERQRDQIPAIRHRESEMAHADHP